MDRGTRAVIVGAGMAMGPDGVADGAADGAAAVALFATNALTALVGGRGASTGAWIIGAASAEVLETPERERRGGQPAASFQWNRAWAGIGLHQPLQRNK